jgi:hypothetical protein
MVLIGMIPAGGMHVHVFAPTMPRRFRILAAVAGGQLGFAPRSAYLWT